MRNHFRNWLAALIGTTALSVASPTQAEATKPKLLRVAPESVYANTSDFLNPVYEVRVFGENFAADSSNLKIYLDGREAEVVWSRPEKKLSKITEGNKDPEVNAERTSGASRLVLWINQHHYNGTIESAVANVEGTSIAKSDEQLPIVLAKRNFGYWFQLGAFGLSFVILAVPVLLVKYSGQSYSVPNKPHWIVAALFLDKETATYSLSKFQFYVWTAVSVFGYVYLFAARCLIQGIWEFIEIPKSLPGLVLISAATGAAAQFVTTQRGPKGAGEEHPAYADFVSSGGVVVAERFQFLVWTVIGSLAFFYLIISQDPASIRVLPTVPDGFLQLMGISSFGYLAGKLARKPGPVLDNVRAEAKGSDLNLTLHGRILSPNATFKITYDKPSPQLKLSQGNVLELAGDLHPEAIVSEPDEQTKPEITARELVLTIKGKDTTLLDGASQFTISNPDGQSASWSLNKTVPSSPATPATNPKANP